MFFRGHGEDLSLGRWAMSTASSHDGAVFLGCRPHCFLHALACHMYGCVVSGVPTSHY